MAEAPASDDADAEAMRRRIARLVCVGTHHKTGTLWMRAVFRRLAQGTGRGYQVVYPNTRRAALPEERMILASWSSRFPDWLLRDRARRILHVIRDPRDVLLSGARYHRHAAPEGERFLHEPRDDLGGRTYQEHLNALPDDRARLLFEMDGKHAETVAEMLAWDYGRPGVVEARYEALMADLDGTLFRGVLRDLGFHESGVERGARIFWQNALFGGLARSEDRIPRVQAHVASGAVAQWREKLPRAVAEPYAERFGAALVALGYEDHPTRWLSRLRDAA